MDIEWDKIRKIIESKDNSAIVKAKTEALNFMERQADFHLKKGCSLQGITAKTFQYNESQLNINKSDQILKFKHELLCSFMLRHGMSIYDDASGIKNGDAIAIKQKNIVFVYDVINVEYPNISVRLVKFVNGSTQISTDTIKISKKNFILGVRLDKDICKISHKSFFFFYNKI